ncbi:MAG TPA: glycosyltransferase family 4 protein [Patescibacteria group bacterium]|nr:glycosyltransferase family 4 protein [Patescibacteria group bacterium]
MRILFCYPWLDLGGAPNTSITLARGLKERGHELFFFTKGGGIYESRLEAAGIPVVTAPHDRFFPHLYHLNARAIRIFRETLDRYAIDVVHAFHMNSYFCALFSAPAKRIPVIYTVVWLLPRIRYPSYPGRVIFVAEEFRDHAAGILGGRPRDTVVIPNRVDLDMFHPDVDWRDFAARTDLPGDGLKISFMSRMDHIKIGSLRYILRAMELLAARREDVTLAIAGDGPLFGEIARLAGQLNERAGRRVVRLLGTILETPQLIAWADIVLGIGRSAFEGMAGGRATLVVGENGLAGVVEPETASILQYYNFSGRNRTEPAEPVVLADEIERIAGEPERHNRLARYAREYVLEHYDYHAGARQLESVYERALEDPPLGWSEQVRLLLENAVLVYGNQWYIACKLKLRSALRSGTAVS